ncbi:MAG: tripartite tricarboxylate transporter substrate binding protein [Nitrospira sp.]|nr:tripartite tricarboxylate transporter substrate binding protein [Nitrospira sp.]
MLKGLLTKLTTTRRGLCLLVGLASLLPLPGHTQEAWPSRAVTIVVPFGAGTGMDVIARILAEELRELHGQPFVIDNRPGASAVLGTSYAAKAVADGYTLIMGGSTSHSAAKSLIASVPYDPIKDFTPIARVVAFPTVLVANHQQPFKTMQEFAVYAKANPGKLSYGSGNATGQVVMEAIKKRLGLDIMRVPYKSNPSAVTDLIGNQVQVMVADFPNSVSHIKNGTLVGLAVTSRDRNALLPDVPSLHETLMPGFEVQAWGGIYGPANLPPSVVSTLSDSLGKILAKPEVMSRLRAAGPEPFYTPAKEFEAYSAAEVDLWSRLANDAGIKAQ